MNSFQRPNPSDEALWRAVSGAAGAPPESCPSAMELAGYLDGRLNEAARDAVEAHLAACDACLLAVREARLLCAEATPAVAPSMVRAAKALVQAPADRERDGARRWRLADWLAATRWPIAAAASVAICLVGYRLGTGVVGGERTSAEDVAAAMSFGAFGTSETDDDFARLFATALEEETP